MPAIKEKELPKFVGILEVRTAGDTGPFTRLACVRGLVATVDTSANTVEVNADDCGTVFSGNRPWITIEAELLEDMGVDTVELLLGGLNRTDVAGTIVAGASQVVTSGSWGYNDPFVIENQNGDGTQLTINSVTGGTDGALVANTDYFVWKNSNWDTIITVIDSTTVTTESQTITVNYDYTPNASEQIEVNSSFTENALFEVKITATDNGKNRTINLTPARFEAPYNMNFLDVVEAGDITGATLTFIWEKDSKLTYKNEIL